MALRIVPAASHPTQTTAYAGAPSAPGVHDTLRANLSLTTPLPSAKASTAPTPTSAHPLESRLLSWRNQQDALKMELLRRQFGIAEPVRRGMERAIVAAGEWRPACLSASTGSAMGVGVHADILAGRDAEIGWEDIFTGDEMRETVDFHAEMEGRFGMSW